MKRKIIGTAIRPRLYVFRSNKHIYAQLINDKSARTIFTISSLSLSKIDKNIGFANCTTSEIVGKHIGQKCQELGITHIVFDRGKKLYHGCIKSVAEGTRTQGIQF